MYTAAEPRREVLTVAGAELTARVQELVRVGNVRRIAIQDESRRTLLEIPLLLGAPVQALDAVWAALGSLGGCVAWCTVVVERELSWPTTVGRRSTGDRD